MANTNTELNKNESTIKRIHFDQKESKEDSSEEDEESAIGDKAPDGIIKKFRNKNGSRSGSSKRISFDPLTLLLDASLVGELELIKKIIVDMPNPSAANNEGITALHNAVCVGHNDIVKFLVEFGCDVNAPDCNGWTPLHCAAACNDLEMIQYLVEHGACIFATTLNHKETAVEKCNDEEEDYEECLNYFRNIKENLHSVNNSEVYAAYNYKAQSKDELNFVKGEKLTVIRMGDEIEKEWWWCKNKEHFGYVPRNLVGLYPLVNL